MPLEFAGVGVESEDAIGIEIVARAAAAVEIGPGVAGGPVDDIEGGIVRTGGPGGGTAHFGGEVTPGVRAGFAFAGDGPEAPGFFPGVGVERSDEAALAATAAGDADEDAVFDGEGGDGGGVAVGERGVGDVENQAAGAAVQGDEMAVGGGEVDLVAEDGEAAVDAGPFGSLGAVVPDLASIAGIEGDHLVGVRDVHEAVVDDGGDLQPFGAVEAVDPFGDEVFGVGGGDLVERRVAGGGVVAVVGEPVGVGGFADGGGGDLGGAGEGH